MRRLLREDGENGRSVAKSDAPRRCATRATRPRPLTSVRLVLRCHARPRILAAVRHYCRVARVALQTALANSGVSWVLPSTSPSTTGLSRFLTGAARWNWQEGVWKWRTRGQSLSVEHPPRLPRSLRRLRLLASQWGSASAQREMWGFVSPGLCGVVGPEGLAHGAEVAEAGLGVGHGDLT